MFRWPFALLVCFWWQWGSFLVMAPRFCLAEDHYAGDHQINEEYNSYDNQDSYHQQDNSRHDQEHPEGNGPYTEEVGEAQHDEGQPEQHGGEQNVAHSDVVETYENPNNDIPHEQQAENYHHDTTNEGNIPETPIEEQLQQEGQGAGGQDSSEVYDDVGDQQQQETYADVPNNNDSPHDLQTDNYHHDATEEDVIPATPEEQQQHEQHSLLQDEGEVHEEVADEQHQETHDTDSIPEKEQHSVEASSPNYDEKIQSQPDPDEQPNRGVYESTPEREYPNNGDQSNDEESRSGVDVSWPMHYTSNRHANPQQGAIRFRHWLKFMQGCEFRYSLEECQRSDAERRMMNLNQPAALMNYTSAGYAKVQAPSGVFSMLKSFHDKYMKEHAVRESWPPGNIYTNHWASTVRMLPVDGLPLTEGQKEQQPSLSPQQRREIISQVQPILESWCRMPLIPTSLYGIRIYKRGSILAPHVDRLPLIISAIINVDQIVDEPWPLEVIDHSGNAVNVTMKPGEMILYESGSIIHGRPYPLEGLYYSNVFLHFEPVGYSEGLYKNADNKKRRKDPKSLFEEALATQQQNQEKNKWMDIKRQNSEKQRPYYVDVKDDEQWNQRYVYVKKSGAKKNKMEVKLAAQASDDRLFHNLAAKGMLARMKQMVEEDITIVMKADHNGWLALHEAARAGKTQVVEYLCSKMTPDQINTRTNDGRGATPLWWALQMFDEYHPTVKALVRHGGKSLGPRTV